jgi:hypothetical protein
MYDIPQIGSRFFWRMKGWTISRLRLEHGKLELSADDGDLQVPFISEFRGDVSRGEILRIAKDRSGRERVVDPDWVSDEGEVARTERQRREAILGCEADAVRGGKSFTTARADIEELCKAKDWEIPCERTVRNWRRAANSHESMLSPQWPLCGNRRQGPDALLLEAMKEVAEAALLSSDRLTLKGAWDFVDALYIKKCEGDEHRPAQPRRRWSIRQLKAFLSRVDWIDQMDSRLDARTRRALTRVAVHPHSADFLWELVEMDAGWLDIDVANAQGENVGRPILYAAIDVGSGYPVGLVLTIQKPSVLPFVECLRFMYFPKEGLDEKHGIKKRIELFAKPIKLNVDNGSEFIGKVAIEVVRALLGDHARCKPFTPQEKPHVERFFGIVREFIRTQPGSVLSAVNKGVKRERPKSEKLLTLEELEGRLFRFIFDEYVFKVNELRSWKWRKAMAPFDLVNEMKKSQMEPFPVNRDEFERVVRYQRQTRALHHDGIAFDGWTYHSEELAQLYRRQGPGRYEFSYSDVDAVTILVHSKDGAETVPATAKQLRGMSIDRQTATAIRKEMAAAGEILNERTVANRLARFEEIKSEGKSVRGKNKAARLQDRLARAREETAKTMPPAPPPPALFGAASSGGTPGPTQPAGAPTPAPTSNLAVGRKRGKR